MLPAPLRLTRAADFAYTVRKGRRSKGGQLLCYTVSQPTVTHSRIGFIVSKKVGNSVIRHRVTRRLRHVIQPIVATFSQPHDVVVRALPGAAGASSHQLDIWLRRALHAQINGQLAAPTSVAPRLTQ